MEEKIIQESGIPYTFLRPSAFMQNFVTQFGNTIKTKTDLDGKNFSEFTEVITRNIIPGNEKNYDDWLQRFMKSERQFPGYLGTTVIVPGGNISSVRYVINRFADQASLKNWENSEIALKLIEEVSKYSTRERVTGLETWFILPNLKTIVAPPRWKMAIVSFIGAYSISLLAQYILGLYLGQMPLLTNILMTIILVLGLTYIAMPLLSRLLQGWLYPRNL
jgi:antibiotic biosynthesis monooxygenase (ABM) superfamily enzyme